MITIEASHVNWGGSLVLLMYLIKTLDGMGIKAVVYLKYEHIFKEYLQTVVTQCFVNNKSEIWS